MSPRPESPRQTVTALAYSRAPRMVIFSLLKDGPAWPRWSMFDGFELERLGNADPLGAGSIRVLSTRISRVREEITSLAPDLGLEYRLLSGLPLKKYRASVSLEDAGQGTAIRWSATFGPQARGTRTFWRLFMHHVLHRSANDLAREGDRISDRAGATAND
jgi:hypothetical protein